MGNWILIVIAIIAGPILFVIFGIWRVQDRFKKTKGSPEGEKDSKWKWEWKKWMMWMRPVIAFLLILIILWIVKPAWFLWWFSDKQLFWGTILGFLAFWLICPESISTLGKKVAILAIVILLLIGLTEKFGMTIPSGYHWEDFRRAFALPPSVTEAPKLPDKGIPWTPARHDGKNALICSLKPGEISALVRFISPRFSMKADSDIIAIVDGKEFFLGRDEVISERKSAEMGLNGFGCKPTLRYKIPITEKEEVPISIVFR